MEYFTYGNLDIVEKMFKSVAMMTGGNSSFESLLIATSLLSFVVLLGMAAFKQSLMPLSSWFFGVMLLWYGMMVPKTDVIIVDQTNVTANRVVSNMPLGLAFMGNVTSSIGKWFTDKAEIVFTPISDISYSKTGLVFGANSYIEASKVNLSNFSPNLQSDWSQYMANCSFYDIVKYNRYSVNDLQSSTDILTLVGNTNQALPTTVHNTAGQVETLFCDQAYTKLYSATLSLTQNQTFLQRFAAALNPSGSSSTTMITQATTNMLSALEASYSNVFQGVQKDAIGIITQEMMINVTKTAALQNAQTTGDTEQMMAALASAQAEVQTVSANNTSAMLAAKYLPIMHNLIEGIIIALFPIMIVMCVLGGISMFQTIIGYLMSILWVKLWPALFAIVNGIGNSTQASQSYAHSFGDGGSTIKNSLDMISVANSTQALAGHMSWIVVALAGVIVMGMRQGIMGAFTSAGASAQSAASSAGSSVGAGNVSMGQVSFNNTGANKDDRSAVHSDPGNMRVNGASGSMQGNAGVSGSMRYSATKNDLPVSSNASYQRSMEASQQASVSMERAKGLASTAQQSKQAAINSGLEFMSGMGMQDAASVMTSASNSAQNKASWSSMTQAGSSLDAQYGLKDGTSTQIMLGASAGTTLQAGSGGKMGGNLSAGGEVKDQGSSTQSYMRDLSAAQNSLQKSGVGFDGSLVDALQKNQQFNQSLNSGNQLAQKTASSMSESQSATLQATDAYRESQAYSAQSREAYTQAQSIGVDQNQAVGRAYEQSGQPLGQVGTSDGLANLASGAAQSSAVQPNFTGTRFEAPKNSVPITPPQGGRAGVEASYQNASSGVDKFNAQNKGQVQNLADGAGFGSVPGDISNAQTALSGQYDNKVAQVSGQIGSTESQVNAARGDMKGNFSRVANDPSTGQKFTNWATGSGDLFEEIKKGVGGEIPNGASGKNYSDVSPNMDRTQDPKPTGSTVVVRPWLKK